MAKSLPPVSAKVIADAEQFINEFRRADNAARRATARIDGEVDRLAKSLKNKFSASELGKGLLQGLGIGSGFALAQQAASALTDFFRQQAEHAKSIEESTARQLDLTKQIIALRWTDEQKAAALDKEIAEKRKELEAAKNAGRFTTTTMGADFQVRTTTGVRPLTDDQQLEVNRRTEELQRKELEREKLLIAREAGVASSRAAQLTSDQARRIASLTEGVKLQKDAFDELLETQRKANAVTEEAREKSQQLAERYRSMADPLRDYRTQLEEIERVRGMLSAPEYLGATGAVRGRMVDAALEEFFGDMDRQSRLFSGVERLESAARDMGWAFSSAFEDAVLGAGQLRDVVNGLLQDVAQIALRSAITQPLGNWAGGLFSGIFGGGKAAGGPVNAGTTYLVGERGPELFTPNREGLIVPNDRLTAGTVRGDSFTFNYSIGAGVTQQQLMPVLAMMKRDIVATIADAKRRRLPVGATF